MEVLKERKEFDLKAMMTSEFPEVRLEQAQPFMELMMQYRCALMEVQTKLNVLNAEFGMGSGINAQFKKFLRTTPTQYQEVLNMYKMLVVDANVVPGNANIGIAFDKVKSLMVK